MIDNFEYNKGKIFYEILGEDNTEVIVFVHGFSLDNRMWESQKEFFARKYKVISYDMRGFGQSTLPTDLYSHHDDLFNLLQKLKVTSCNLVGLSLGGEISIDFTIEYPELVKNLILLDTSLSGYSSTVNWDVKAKEMGIEIAKQNWLNHEVFSSLRKNQGIQKKLLEIINDYSGWHWINKDIREKINPNAVNRLSEIKARTLVIVGQEDLSYFKDIASIVCANIPESTKIIIKNAGHMTNLEQSGVVNSVILKFIEHNV